MRIPLHRRRVLVVGAGAAGLAAALGAGEATVLTEGHLGAGGSTPLAQGGVAAALGGDDSPALHAADTVRVSGGLGSQEAAEALAAGGPEAVAWLARLGARFDRADGRFALGREAGHSVRRIVHAADATGAELIRTLAAAGAAAPGVEICEGVRAVDLLRLDGRVVGVLAAGPDGAPVAYLADAVLLATGGYAACFARTTNPRQNLGAGVAMAARAGAALADLEFVQFHPTALAVNADPLPLLTEALRGEGAVLVDENGERFMPAEHPDAELAPRDVVARANFAQLERGHRPALDARLIGERFPERFPQVFRLAQAHGLDPRREPLPVSPAAHYCMGGVAVDLHGRTSLPGLWAVGEAASSGLHGANRLASNSLLEGLVMGRLAAADASACSTASVGPAVGQVEAPAAALCAERRPGAELLAEVRELLWRHAGVVRTGAGLAAAAGRLAELGADAESASLEARDAWTVASLVVDAALGRCESRGAHFRADVPLADPDGAVRRLTRLAPPPSVRLTIVGDELAAPIDARR